MVEILNGNYSYMHAERKNNMRVAYYKCYSQT